MVYVHIEKVPTYEHLSAKESSLTADPRGLRRSHREFKFLRRSRYNHEGRWS